MSHARYLVGDVRKILPTLEAGSVDLVLTSPPFLALRSYLPSDHPDKPAEIGSEPTPGAYIDTLLEVVELLTPLLAGHGSMCFELGDTYSGSGGSGGDYNENGLRDGQPKFRAANYVRGRLMDHDSGRRAPAAGWPLDKSLCLIPELFRVALVYGFNPLTGRRTPRWRARNVIRWCRPNPPVGALGDKVRPATSEMLVVCKDRSRFFDLDAVRTPYSENSHARTANGAGAKTRTAKTDPGGNRHTLNDLNNEGAGAPPLDFWVMPTQPYPGAHYATWPEALCVKPIEMMCPRRVCRHCGKPSERIVEATRTLDGQPADLPMIGTSERAGAVADGIGHWRKGTTRTDLGWSDCGHDDWRPGLVLDPFAGSGTTLQVATGHGRDAIGVDLDERNARLAERRVGMFLAL